MEKIAAIAKVPHRETDPIVIQFRKEAADKLQSLQTVEDVGSISMIVQDVAAKHFPRSPPSGTKMGHHRNVEGLETLQTPHLQHHP